MEARDESHTLRKKARKFLRDHGADAVRKQIRRVCARRRHSTYDEYLRWKKLKSRRNKLLVAGSIPLRRRDSRWRFALGLRGRGKDGKGSDVDKWSAPVGKNREITFEEGKLGSLRKLPWIASEDRSDELFFTAAKKLNEEFSFPVELDRFAGRIRPFTGDYPSILVNLFLYMARKKDEAEPDGKDITAVAWVPVDLLLEAAPECAGMAVETWLQNREGFEDTALMHGLYAAGMRRLQELLVMACA